jgi:hypothetical protein
MPDALPHNHFLRALYLSIFEQPRNMGFFSFEKKKVVLFFTSKVSEKAKFIY